MSIIYRPHRGGLADAMQERKEFETIEKMKEYIVKQWEDKIGSPFDINDIVVGDKICNDERTRWKDTRYVCIKRYRDEDYIQKYGCAQCIGMMATEYDDDYWEKSPYNIDEN